MPRAPVDLALELAGPPAGIAGHENRPARPVAPGDGAEHPGGRADADLIAHREFGGDSGFGRVDDETGSGGDGPAIVDGHLARVRGRGDFQLLVKRGGLHPSDRAVDDEPEGALLVVADHQDDGFLKPGVAHPGGGDEEVARVGEAVALGTRPIGGRSAGGHRGVARCPGQAEKKRAKKKRPRETRQQSGSRRCSPGWSAHRSTPAG